MPFGEGDPKNMKNEQCSRIQLRLQKNTFLDLTRLRSLQNMSSVSNKDNTYMYILHLIFYTCRICVGLWVEILKYIGDKFYE